MSNQNESRMLDDQLNSLEFDAVSYLNEMLPPLTLSSQATLVKQNRNSQLQSTWSELQTLLGKLNTYNVRTSTELSITTDEILRSGSRLAYEVEVLRSDANNFYELISETLQDDIRLFLQSEVSIATKVGDEAATATSEPGYEASREAGPDFMQELRLLGLVKARLERVVAIFGEALKWPVPPSDVSVTSSLISVSAPELGVANSVEDDKARAVNKQHRDEIVDLLNASQDRQVGVERAQKRLNDFRNLSQVWNGTIEEKARTRIVDSFARVVDDRRAQIGQSTARRPDYESTKSSAQASRVGTPGLPTGGILGGLRKLRDEIYLE